MQALRYAYRDVQGCTSSVRFLPYGSVFRGQGCWSHRFANHAKKEGKVSTAKRKSATVRSESYARGKGLAFYTPKQRKRAFKKGDFGTALVRASHAKRGSGRAARKKGR